MNHVVRVVPLTKACGKLQHAVPLTKANSAGAQGSNPDIQVDIASSRQRKESRTRHCSSPRKRKKQGTRTRRYWDRLRPLYPLLALLALLDLLALLALGCTSGPCPCFCLVFNRRQPYQYIYIIYKYLCISRERVRESERARERA
jgi:hypothetical protein